MQSPSLAFKVASASGVEFTDSSPGDVVYYPSTTTQRLLFGTNISGSSMVKVSQSNIIVGGSILPNTTLIHDLGSDELRFRDLYLSGNTINLGGTTISATADGVLTIPMMNAPGIDTSNITTSNLNAYNANLSNVTSDVGTILSLNSMTVGATNASLGSINATIIETQSLEAVNVDINNTTTSNLFANTSVISSAQISNLTVPVQALLASASVSNLSASNIVTPKGIITDALFSTVAASNATLGTGMITSLTAPTMTSSNVTASNGSFTVITSSNMNTNTLTASTINADTLAATLLDVTSINVNSYDISSSNITCSNVTSSNVTVRNTLQTQSLLANSLSASNISTGGTLRIDSGGGLSNVFINTTSISAGTLGVPRGGTGASNLTANKVLVGNGTAAILQPTGLHWDSANNRMGINTSVPSEALHVSGNILASSNITAFSDIRLKTNIEKITQATERIRMLNGYTYSRIGEPEEERYAGVIAQEVRAVLPEAVSIHENGLMSVAYGNMISLLIEGIKDLDERIRLLERT